MKIKIADLDKIGAELNRINGNASAHTASASQIMAAAEQSESELEALGIPKSERSGAKITFRSGNTVPHAYKYTRIINVVTLVRGSAGWFFTGATRDEAFPNADHGAALMLTAAQDASAVANLRTGYSVAAAVESATATA